MLGFFFPLPAMAAGGCPDDPFGGGESLDATVTTVADGRPLTDGAVVPVDTALRFDAVATAFGHCVIKTPKCSPLPCVCVDAYTDYRKIGSVWVLADITTNTSLNGHYVIGEGSTGPIYHTPPYAGVYKYTIRANIYTTFCSILPDKLEVVRTIYATTDNTISLSADPAKVWANGHEETELAVVVTDAAGQGVAGRAIALSADPWDDVIIEPTGGQTVTDVSGKARFNVRSTKVGLVTFTATVIDEPALTDSARAEFIQRSVVLFVPGINTELFVQTDQTTFPFVRQRLVAKGFSRPAKGTPEEGIECANMLDDDGDDVPNDGCPLILNYSYNGGFVDPATGIWSPNPYNCGNTAQSLFGNSIPLLKNLIEDFARENPNTRFVIIGHSQGGLIALRGLELLFERPDLAIDAVITLDGALGGAPDNNSFAAAAITCWGNPAATELVQLWDTAGPASSRKHKEQGTNASNNKALVEFARSKGTRVLTVGSGNDCIWDLRQCGLLGPNNSSTQIVKVAGANVIFRTLGGNCGLGLPLGAGAVCILPSHLRVLEHPYVLARVGVFVGSPTIP